jgi:hypothetical protein
VYLEKFNSLSRRASRDEAAGALVAIGAK